VKFKILARNEKNETAVFIYDNETSFFALEGDDLEGELGFRNPQTFKPFRDITSVDQPSKKDSNIKTLKVSLGLSCNYECTYCSQRFVPHGDSTNQHDIDEFLRTLTSNLTSDPERVEFWGGEPFVYWKTLKPLAENIRKVYPNAVFSIITNGSLLDAEKNEWLDNMGFSVGFSHDGPGYHARGLDPLDNPEQAAAIMDLAQRLGPKNRFSVNAMLHKDNTSRAEIQTWIESKFGVGVPIGEGTFIDPYDEGGLDSMFRSTAEHLKFRTKAYDEIRTNKTFAFGVVTDKITEFIASVESCRPANTLGQKCGMDKSDTIAIDMKGNVITCQNVSAVANAPNGRSHKIGHITDLKNVKLDTSTHWSKRPECLKCPVLQLCKGACMFLEGKLWESACDGAYSDNIPFMAAAIEAMTGFMPYYIDGPQREDRKDIFGLVNGIPEAKQKKPFPIPVVAG
jgi:uncharacterized protein